jgi:UDP-N-acetylglucosamine acyltransferase
MKRLGFSRETIQNLRHAYRLLFSNEGTLVERLADLEGDDIAQDPHVREIVEFVKAQSDRSLCVPRNP